MSTMAMDGEAVRRWLREQRKAEEILIRERRHRLRSLTLERALQVYLDLTRALPATRRDAPSCLLTAMRRAAGRMQEARRS